MTCRSTFFAVLAAMCAVQTVSAQCGDYFTTFPGTNAFCGYSMAYDTHRERAVMFGGGNRSQVYLDETWVFDGNTWSRLDAVGPARRVGAAMIYDAARGEMILFGGSDHATIYNDTWAFDGASWRRLDVTGPSARTEAGFAYDEVRHEAILFGGTTGPGGALSDCWVWTGSSWREVPGPGPASRASHSMVFDQSRSVVVLFGGRRDALLLGDTWEWDGLSWQQRAGAGPGPRGDAAIVYATAYGKSLLIAGNTPLAAPPFLYDYDDMWTWDGVVWTQIADHPFPDYYGPTSTVACYEPQRGTILLGPGYRQGLIVEQTERHIAMLPPGVLDQPDDELLCNGGTAMFSTRAVGMPELLYSWTRDGIDLEDGPTTSGSVISGSASPTLTIADTSPADEGLYACIISSACGLIATEPAELRICRADLACDGVIDFTDYLEFLNLYESADPRADFTADGVIDFADYLEFLNSYDAGC